MNFNQFTGTGISPWVKAIGALDQSWLLPVGRPSATHRVPKHETPGGILANQPTRRPAASTPHTPASRSTSLATTFAGRVRYSCASRCTPGGHVADHITVCRSPRSWPAMDQICVPWWRGRGAGGRVPSPCPLPSWGWRAPAAPVCVQAFANKQTRVRTGVECAYEFVCILFVGNSHNGPK